MKTKLVYISAGAGASPAGIKSALDEIRKTLDLPADAVLFGLPVDEEADTVSVAVAGGAPQSRKVIKFPEKKSILNVIKNHEPEDEAPIAPEIPEIKIADGPLVVEDVDADDGAGRSITDLMGDMPGMSEDEPPKKPGLIEEFGDFLASAPEEPAPKPTAKPRPFGRKGKGPLNILGDLFSYAGMAANDDVQDFILPDFIKRP